jgi:hypothetical protein
VCFCPTSGLTSVARRCDTKLKAILPSSVDLLIGEIVLTDDPERQRRREALGHVGLARPRAGDTGLPPTYVSPETPMLADWLTEHRKPRQLPRTRRSRASRGGCARRRGSRRSTGTGSRAGPDDDGDGEPGPDDDQLPLAAGEAAGAVGVHLTATPAVDRGRLLAELLRDAEVCDGAGRGVSR